MSIKMVPSTVPTHLNSFNNIFNKDRCPKCDGAIVRMEIDTRRAFACEVCQPTG